MLQDVSYPGGKNGAGVFQMIINHMPPHRVYLEPFAGGAAVLRLKRPAALSIAADRDPAAIEAAIAALAGTGATLELPAASRLTDFFQRLAKSAVARRGTPGPASGDRPSSTLARGSAPAPRAGSGEGGPSPVAAMPGQSEFWFLVGDGIALLERYPFRGDELVYCDPPYLAATRTRRKL